MVFFIIVMPILSVLFAEWRLKRATSNTIENTIEDVKSYVLEAIQKPEFGVLIQGVGAQLAHGMMTVGGKEIKHALPKFKLNDIIGMVAMKFLNVGNLGSLMGGNEEPAENSNTSLTKGKLE